MAAEASACTGCSSTFSPSMVGSVDQLAPSSSFCATKTTVRPEPTWVAVTVTAERMPASRCCWMRANGTASVMRRSMADGIDEADAVLGGGRDGRRAADERAHEREQLAAIDREHAIDGEVGPDVDEPAGAGARIVGEGGEAAGVERAHRGAAQDVERWVAAEVARDLLEDVLDDADLVGAARGAAGEHQRDLAATVGCAGHPWTQRHRSHDRTSRRPRAQEIWPKDRLSVQCRVKRTRRAATSRSRRSAASQRQKGQSSR